MTPTVPDDLVRAIRLAHILGIGTHAAEALLLIAKRDQKEATK